MNTIVLWCEVFIEPSPKLRNILTEGSLLPKFEYTQKSDSSKLESPFEVNTIWKVESYAEFVPNITSTLSLIVLFNVIIVLSVWGLVGLILVEYITFMLSIFLCPVYLFPASKSIGSFATNWVPFIIHPILSNALAVVKRISLQPNKEPPGKIPPEPTITLFKSLYS